MEAPTAADVSTRLQEIIDLNSPNFSGGNPANFEAELEWLLADLEESGVRAAVPVIATVTRAMDPSDKEPALEAIEAGRPEPGPVEVVGAPGPQPQSRLARRSSESPWLTQSGPSLHPLPRPWSWKCPSWAHRSRCHPDSPPLVVETAPIASPPHQVPQEHNVPESGAQGASQEIQEVGEGLGAGLLPETAEGNAWITDFVRSTWSAAWEVDAPDDEDEEAVTYHRLE